MKIYCTICSKEKVTTKQPLAAIKRYDSPRIHAVFARSRKDGVELRILSGKFGLLAPEEPIPSYDYQLTLAEVPALKEQVVKQIRVQHIDEIILFAKTLPEWRPYIIVLELACKETATLLTIKEL
ncbi:MAG TPA: hypothetical protein VLJ21_04880 [Candidatus Binatia bacterium]|nr:hypothetical protein [Candidatus Binatia bacterium]